jgi:hypothetical protein
MSKRAKAGGASKAVPLPLSDYGKARAAWRAEVQAGLGGKANPKNRSGIEVKPIYTPEDHAGDGYMDALGFPGQLPMTRGIYATMHRGRTWTQRQLIGLGVPEDYNARLKTILAHGGTAVSLIPCNSVYRGYDIDEMPIEILGTCGVTVNSVQDMEISLDGIPIGEISTALNDPSPFTLLALELAVAKRRGIAWTRISGTCSWITLPSRGSMCHSGIRCRSSASICSRRGQRRPRPWDSPCRRPFNTRPTAWRGAGIRTSSCRASHSSSTSP